MQYPRQQLAMLSLHVLVRINCFGLQNSIRDNSTHSYFWPWTWKNWKHYVTPTSFMADLSKPWKISSVRLCEIDREMVIHNLVAISLFFAIRGKVEGAVPASPIGAQIKISTPCVLCIFSFGKNGRSIEFTEIRWNRTHAYAPRRTSGGDETKLRRKSLVPWFGVYMGSIVYSPTALPHSPLI